jgi:uncharacterized damage-inducible protein DinB
MAETNLKDQIKNHWQQLRGRTYDLLAHLQNADLSRRLPFAESQAIGYQLWCMLGTQESFTPTLETGHMKGWACSLDQIDPQLVNIERIKQQMQAADEELLSTIDRVELLSPLPDGHSPLEVCLNLVEHESHHQGQLINFIYAHQLPIPDSWADQWALSRE